MCSGLVLLQLSLLVCQSLVCVRIHSAERYSNMVDEGIIINAIGVTMVAILAVVMYILSRDKFKAPESREAKASIDL